MPPESPPPNSSSQSALVTESSTGDSTPEEDASSPMPIVGIGASAGGIDALQHFFSALPAESDMAFVVILHLSPDHESSLASILQQYTDMPVVQGADDGTSVRANHVYVIGPGHRLGLQNGTLRVSDADRPHDISTIDRFFHSLAADQGDNAVGIVLSGTGSDGTLGLRSIKEKGGVTFVQAPDDAQFDDMPRSAIAMGLIDLIRPVEELATKLVEYRDSAGVVQLPKKIEALGEDGRSTLKKILTRLYKVTGVDFSAYKRSTVLQRLERRLKVHSLPSLEAYLHRLEDDKAETRALYKDLLTSVTSFFRDPEAFAALEEQVIPAIFEDKGAEERVRVWVPGCATGEEAYSLAILLQEYADTLDRPPNYQVFATDVDEEALDVGREGLFPESIQADVSEDRLQRFFDVEESHYRVDRQLRDRILFAEHNLLTDPSFSNLDLVSCRNLLVYLNDEAIERVLGLFHYGLGEDGYLFLGQSETGYRAGRLFSTVDESNTILQAQPVPQGERAYPPFSDFTVGKIDLSTRDRRSKNRRRSDASPPKEDGLSQTHRQVLMDTVASVLVNDDFDIVHLTDRASRYLRFSKGAPTHDFFSTLPKALRSRLRSALTQVFENNESVKRTDLLVPIKGEIRALNFVVEPVEHESGERLAHVRFEDTPTSDDREVGVPDDEAEETDNPQAELRRTREQLQATTEEYKTATEEMEAANEELLSMNEELHSKNEELMTSKEELQSLYEELKTTNEELKTKIDELRETNSVLENLMDATEIATLFLDRDLKIQRYTPRVTELFSIQTMDVGRPLSDFAQRFDYDSILDDAQTVLDELTTIEREVHQSDGKYFLVRLRPYRTVDDRIEGVVVTFIDITSRRNAEEARRRSEEFHRLAVEAAGVGTWSVDLETGSAAISPRMAMLMGYAPGEFRTAPDQPEHGHWQQVVPREAWVSAIHPDDRPAVEQAMEASRETGVPFDLEYRVEHDDETRWIYGRGEVTEEEESRVLRGASVDLTQQKRAQEELRRERNFVDRILDTVGALVVVLDEDQRLVRVNNEAQAVAGYTLDELRDMDWREELIPDEQADELQSLLSRLWAGEAPIQFEIPLITADGGERLIDWTSTVLRDESGEAQFAIGTGIDVTERRALEKAIVDAGEEVRRQIGQDLHDVLSSDLAALAMKADNLRYRIEEERIERTQALDRLVDLIEGLRGAADRSRTLSHALVPVSLQEEHLAAALDTLCHEQEELTGVMYTFEGDRNETLPRDDETAMHMYRVAHEAVTNVRRHAKADHVWVSLHRTDDELVLTVEDDGVGLPDTFDNKDGVGLRSMSYRADVIGASLSFGEGDEGGTVVRCSLPLDKARLG